MNRTAGLVALAAMAGAAVAVGFLTWNAVQGARSASLRLERHRQ